MIKTFLKDKKKKNEKSESKVHTRLLGIPKTMCIREVGEEDKKPATFPEITVY